MPRFCASCGAQVADTAAFCPGCGKPMTQTNADSAAGSAPGAAAAPTPTPVQAAPAGGELADNVAGMLAYITIIPAIIFLVMEPYNKKPFVRFHAFQCLFIAGAWFALAIVLKILWIIPFFGLLLLFITPLLGLLFLVAALICLLKAYQGQMWRLPVIGDLAAKQAGV
jgi:uncharacterized membrane protein